jgi:hypothetical protein
MAQPPYRGMRAKPILDILVGVSPFDDWDKCRVPLEGLGYDYVANAGVPHHHIFGRGRDSTERTLLVHVVEFLGDSWRINRPTASSIIRSSRSSAPSPRVPPVRLRRLPKSASNSARPTLMARPSGRRTMPPTDSTAATRSGSQPDTFRRAMRHRACPNECSRRPDSQREQDNKPPRLPLTCQFGRAVYRVVRSPESLYSTRPWAAACRRSRCYARQMVEVEAGEDAGFEPDRGSAVASFQASCDGKMPM